MSHLVSVIEVELLKARRSKMPVLTAAGFLLAPLAGGFFMVILKDPDLARRVGLISAKAQLLAGTADWPTYLELLAQATAIGGLILFSLIGSWVFGREYVDGTAKDLLALPTPRSAIVAAKFVAIVLWSLALTAIMMVAGLGIGLLVVLPQGSTLLLFQGGVTVTITAVLTIASVTPIIFFASAGHGYLPPVGAAILALFLTQVIAIAGWGEYFPWSIPALYSQGQDLGLISYLILLLASVAGMASTVIWWALADHVH
jgi:ABC-2 type transport system permease protein